LLALACGADGHVRVSHEIWEYRDKKWVGTARLKAVEIICQNCHDIHHWGRTKKLIDRGEVGLKRHNELKRHFRRVNDCTQREPSFNARGIAARRRVTGNPWFKRGTLFRAALEAMRAAQGAMTVREIVDAVIAAKGITGATAKQHDMLQQAVRSSLDGHDGKTVERVGEGSPMRWKIIG
jgi:hypothetical protein